MATEMPVTEARERFSELVETSAHEPVFLTKRDKCPSWFWIKA